MLLISIYHLRQPLKCYSIDCQTISSLATATTNGLQLRLRAPPYLGLPLKPSCKRSKWWFLLSLLRNWGKGMLMIIRKDPVPSFHRLLNTTLPGLDVHISKPRFKPSDTTVHEVAPKQSARIFHGTIIKKRILGQFRLPITTLCFNVYSFVIIINTCDFTTSWNYQCRHGPRWNAIHIFKQSLS